MSERICYLQRTDRGLALAGVRMVGSHADDQWEVTTGGSPDAILETIDDAAVWIKQRLKSGGGSSRTLPILCLDTDGAICTWTKPEDTNEEMITAAIDQLDSDQEDELEAGFQTTMGERFPNLPLEVNYEPLNDQDTSDGSRRAVVASPDVPARLLIDQLDSMGIRIERVENLWSLIAMAWDPGAPHRSNARDSQRVISTDDPVCACAILDTARGRLIWTWSKCGNLLAAGSIRISHTSEGLFLQQSDLSRLCADWIGWATQLGVSPLRVVMVLPENGLDNEHGLDRSGVGSIFAQHWPTATTDVLTQDDPLLATLRSAIEHEYPSSTKSSPASVLTNRPGRAHRSMYRWAAGMLIIAGAAIGWTGWSLYSKGSATLSDARTVRSAMSEQLMTVRPPITSLALPGPELQERLRRLIARNGPMEVTPNKPVLKELETISFILGMSGIEIDSVQITHTIVKLKIRAADLSTAEQINEALRSINSTDLQWRISPELAKRGDQIEATFTATWITGSTS
ncbi:MAG: hypothetical protein AB8C13_04565 [Phycisphaerales bacterium]